MASIRWINSNPIIFKFLARIRMLCFSPKNKACSFNTQNVDLSFIQLESPGVDVTSCCARYFLDICSSTVYFRFYAIVRLCFLSWDNQSYRSLCTSLVWYPYRRSIAIFLDFMGNRRCLVWFVFNKLNTIYERPSLQFIFTALSVGVEVE